LVERKSETLILHEGGLGFSSYRWWTTARLYADGLELSLPPPLAIGHPPIFIPRDDLKLERHPWYMNSDASAIAAPRAAQMTIIIDDTLADALRTLDPQARPERAA